MWVWPQLVFGGPPPSPIVIGGPFPQAKPLPSPPSPSVFPPPLLALFARLREGRPRLVGGRGPSAQGGGGRGGPTARAGLLYAAQKPGDRPNLRKNALGARRPSSELLESCGVFWERLVAPCG